MAEAQKADAGTQEAEYVEPPRIQVVTPDNFDDYVTEKLGPLEPAQTPEEMEEELKAEDATKQQEAENKEKEPEKQRKGGKKHELNERFSELTEARKAAEKRAEEQAARAKALQEERDRVAAEAAALKAKYEPPKSDEPEPEPKPEQFKDVGEYAKALKDWSADNARREDSRKAQEAAAAKERAEAQKAWNERLAATKAEIEDYEQAINESSVKVSDEVRDAILESDVGPKLLYHFAKNPEDAERIGKMTVGRALKELGKLEVKLAGGPAAVAAPKSEAKSEPKTTVAEISKAPAPITPLGGSTTPVQPKMDAEGNFHGTYEEWKAFRRAGKIK